MHDPDVEPWDGSPLDGRTVLLHTDVPAPDALRLLRYAGWAREVGGRLILAVPAPLVPVFAGCPHVDRVVALDHLPGSVADLQVDVHTPLSHLPRLFGTEPDTVSRWLPYLRRVGGAGLGPLRVGVAEGLPVPPNPAGVAWVRVPADERHLARSVSALAALDLLVAGNDLLTHLAGAMGVTVWVVLSEGEAPAWAGGGECTPWYPSMRLFRPGPRGTSALWARVTEELHAVAAGDRFRLRTLHRYAAGHAPSREPGSPGAPRVSVVMPVWNAARHLPRALASLRGQTCPDWELLAVDDGSDDPSPALLRAAARDDPRVVALCLPANRGPAAARNAALRRARGEWVTYLDSDDAFEPGHLARLARPGIEADVLVFAYDVYEDPGDGPPRFGHTWDPVFKRDRLHVRNPCTPLGLAHRRSLLDLAGLFDERVAYQEDWDLWKRLAATGAVFGFTPERSGRYYRRPDGLAATRRRPTNAPREPGTSW